MSRAIRAEWTKLRTAPSTTWAVVAVVAVTFGSRRSSRPPAATDANEVGLRADDDIVASALRGVWLGQVAMVVLGALAATSEFATRTIRATLPAIPRRCVLVEGRRRGDGRARSRVREEVASFEIAQPLLHEGGYNPPAYPHVMLADTLAVRAVFGSGLYLTFVALFAFGVATIVRRHTR